MDDLLVSDFTKAASPEFQSITIQLIRAIRQSGQDFDMAMKWGQLTFAKTNDFHHWICAVKITKKFVGLTFHFGGLLSDPRHVFIAGESKFSRKLIYHQVAEVDSDIICDFIKEAVGKLQYFKENWKKIQESECSPDG